jgi:hypothetical protein
MVKKINSDETSPLNAIYKEPHVSVYRAYRLRHKLDTKSLVGRRIFNFKRKKLFSLLFSGIREGKYVYQFRIRRSNLRIVGIETLPTPDDDRRYEHPTYSSISHNKQN